jgi:signal transduction histidine kinase
MNHSGAKLRIDDSLRQQPMSFIPEFIEAFWPATRETDSPLRRQKIWVARCVQLGMLLMVGTALAKTIVAELNSIPAAQTAGLGVAGALYLGWSLYGVQGAVRSLLQEGPTLRPKGKSATPVDPAVFFGIQLGLALMVCLLGSRRSANPLAWVILLPPVAQSVFQLRGSGIAAVAGLSLTIFTANTVWWRGWNSVPAGLPAFFFAVLFTLAFSLLAAGAENARQEVQRLAGELSEANQRLREYAVQSAELAMTRERNRLAREIHDSIGHCLTVVNVKVEAARALLDHEPARAREILDKVRSVAQGGLRDVRHSVTTLRVSPLDNQSLVEALRLLVQQGNASGLTAELIVSGTARPLPPPATLTLYRAAQEGLTNVRKHAPQAAVRLTLDFSQSERVNLSVRDNGPGAPSEGGPTRGFGLLGLRERAHLVGGLVRTRSETGQGVTLEVEVPG